VCTAQHAGNVARPEVGSRLGQGVASHPPGRDALQVSIAGGVDLGATVHILLWFRQVALIVATRLVLVDVDLVALPITTSV
jgi:hypothetical protein